VAKHNHNLFKNDMAFLDQFLGINSKPRQFHGWIPIIQIKTTMIYFLWILLFEFPQNLNDSKAISPTQTLQK
jgi:hypothetical protein